MCRIHKSKNQLYPALVDLLMLGTRNIFMISMVWVLLGGCTEEKVPERFYPRSDHEAYWYSLKQANLLNTALGREWQKAAKDPFDNEIEIELPFQEAFMIDDREPIGLGYEFDVRRGQKILAEVGIISEDTSMIFIDLFRVEDDSLGLHRHVASADSTLMLGFEPRRDGKYLLRIQPELLMGGDFRLKISKVPSLEFPVTGRNESAIQSFFGDPRDGGRREHHGVDIFARRHTPIIAPSPGYVRFVGERGLGGNVVWIYDSDRRYSLYFAHLEKQLVERYTYVETGDTIGTVGNSGNARTTPPHLHFGIYQNGPVDPYYFIVDEIKETNVPEIEIELLRKEMIASKQIPLKSHMNSEGVIVDTIEISEYVNILAVNHDYLRVKTEDGEMGFIGKSSLNFLGDE